MTHQEAIRVLVADDYPALRTALASLFESTEGLELAGCAADADEAIEIAAREQPDVALVDLRMPAGGGSAAARGIAECSPHTRIIALTASSGQGGLGLPFADRIRKGLSTSEIVDVVRRVAGQPALLGPQPELSGCERFEPLAGGAQASPSSFEVPALRCTHD